MTVFDTAWALMKAEPYIDTGSSMGGFYDSDGDFDPDDKGGYNQRRKADRYYEDSMRPYIGQRDGLLNTPRTDADGNRFFSGSSLPRQTADNKFVGVNVADMDWENNFDEAVQQFSDIADHEWTHYNIDDEITEWANDLSGYNAKQKAKQEKVAQKKAEGSKSFPWARVTDSKFDNVVPNRNVLHSLGHEYGAFSSLGPDKRKENMMKYPELKPIVSGEKDASDYYFKEGANQ